MTDRKATDILLGIESELKTLSRRLQNVENLQKLLVKKANEIPSPTPAHHPQQHLPHPQTSHTPVETRAEEHDRQVQEEQTWEPTITRDNFDARQKTNRFSEMAAEAGVKVEEDNPSSMQTFVARQSELPPDPRGEDLIEAPGRSPSRGQRGPKGKVSKSSVSQVITRGDTPLFLANIEVLDNTGQMINQTRTNPKGRWLMALAPGDYQVHVVKRFPPDSGKESIDTMYQIQVPPSDKPMELDQLSLGE